MVNNAFYRYQQLFYYESYVEPPEYEKQLAHCHFVRVPLQKKITLLDCVEESYGLTMASGGIFDAVRHAKPLLVPERIILAPELQAQSITYGTPAQLVDTLIALAAPETESYSIFTAAAVQNALRFTPDAVRSTLPFFST